MPAILFVCTANICRSPMAMEIFKRASTQIDDLGKWQVDSAGTWAIAGLHASENSQIVIDTMGMDLSNHLSRDVSDLNLLDYDLILTMEAGHKEAILIEHPEVKNRIFLLSEMVGSSFDIADPIGRNLSEYEETATLLEDLINRGIPHIIKLLRERED